MSSSVYTLNSGDVEKEKERLNWQHNFCKPAFGGNLLPTTIRAYLESQDSPAVAEVATGTGIWLQDLAAQLPSSSRLDGYDYDSSKFPAQDAVPSNIHFKYADALKSFPDYLHGIYDVVHVRFMMYCLRANEWSIVARNLKQLLKPGGWIVWEDLGYPSWTSLPMGPSFANWIALDVKYAAHVGRDTLMPLSLKTTFEDHGYVNCSEEMFSLFKLGCAKDTGGMATVRAAQQSMMGMIEKGGFENIQSEDDVNEIVDGMIAELDQGHRMGLDMWRIVGQNPV